MENAKYLEEVLEKYDFITKLYISDTEGNLIASARKDNQGEEEEAQKTFRMASANVYNDVIGQIKNEGKSITKGITSFYDNFVLYQSKINNTFLIQIISQPDEYNHSIIEEIIQELKIKLEKIEKEIESTKKEGEN